MLPEWPGSKTVYARAEKIAAHIQADAYKAQREAYKRKTGFVFSPDPEGLAICEAMDAGDENYLKATIAKYLDVALS